MGRPREIMLFIPPTLPVQDKLGAGVAGALVR